MASSSDGKAILDQAIKDLKACQKMMDDMQPTLNKNDETYAEIQKLSGQTRDFRLLLTRFYRPK